MQPRRTSLLSIATLAAMLLPPPEEREEREERPERVPLLLAPKPERRRPPVRRDTVGPLVIGPDAVVSYPELEPSSDTALDRPVFLNLPPSRYVPPPPGGCACVGSPNPDCKFHGPMLRKLARRAIRRAS